MKRITRFGLAVWIASPVLAACTSTSPAGSAASAVSAFADAWKAGTVTAVGPAVSLGDAIERDCRPLNPADDEGTQRFAKVAYFSGRHAHVRIVPVPAGWQPVEGDAVLLKTSGCRDVLKPKDP